MTNGQHGVAHNHQAILHEPGGTATARHGGVDFPRHAPVVPVCWLWFLGRAAYHCSIFAPVAPCGSLRSMHAVASRRRCVVCCWSLQRHHHGHVALPSLQRRSAAGVGGEL